MRFVLRLYRWHDTDLLYLYKHPNFNFHKAVKECLWNYFEEDKPFWIEPPQSKGDLPDKQLPASVTLQVTLNDEEFADVIENLGKIKRRFRNGFIKALVRNYLIFSPLDLYFLDDYEIAEKSFTNREIRSFNERRKKRRKIKQNSESVQNIEEFINEEEMSQVESIKSQIFDDLPPENSFQTEDDKTGIGKIRQKNQDSTDSAFPNTNQELLNVPQEPTAVSIDTDTNRSYFDRPVATESSAVEADSLETSVANNQSIFAGFEDMLNNF